MKINIEETDIELITKRLLESLRPILQHHKSMPEDRVLNVRDLSDYLRVSKSWIYQRTRLNEIPFIRIDGQLLFKRSSIDKWLEGNQVPAIPGN